LILTGFKMSDIEEGVKKIITEILITAKGFECKEIKNDDDLEYGLGADSFDIIEIVMSTEDAFDITISDELIEHLKTVGDVVYYAEKLINGECIHLNVETIWKTIKGESIEEPDHDVCIDCGKIL
jgi:acyl carrier protein